MLHLLTVNTEDHRSGEYKVEIVGVFTSKKLAVAAYKEHWAHGQKWRDGDKYVSHTHTPIKADEFVSVAFAGML